MDQHCASHIDGSTLRRGFKYTDLYYKYLAT